ncbi:hypothetical protein Btru_027935 [Bulinus truncatus]|nr:hypothetical protein Btru_027935 [Bulinus truncatus]
MNLLIHLLIACHLFADTFPHLHSTFKQFQILTPSHLRTRIRKEASFRRVLSKTVHFTAFGRTFHVHLEPGSPVFDPDDFEVRLASGNGSLTTSVQIKRSAFYVGHLTADRSSVVDASYVAGTWSMLIRGKENVFVEPLRRFDCNGRARWMVAYRQRDIRTDNLSWCSTDRRWSFCGVQDFINTTGTESRFQDESWSRFHEYPDLSVAPFYGHAQTEFPNVSGGSREPHQRRRLPRRRDFYFNTCDMVAVMDAQTFRGVGEGSPYKSASMLLYWYQLADSIFKRAQFGIFRGMRLKIRTIYILSEYTASKDPHFNKDPTLGVVHPDEVIKSLSGEKWFNQYCLAHLTTERQFSGSLLGLASVGNVPVYNSDDYRSDHPFWHMGICAADAANVAFSCVKAGNNILTDAMYMVILTHEIAHGWGAQHDDFFSEAECSPREVDGGKYIMWSGHNGGKDLNSLKFSPCSANSVQEVLLYKAHKCLLPAHVATHLCGDSILEFPEQCDEGLTPGFSCCTQSCRLKEGALCSPVNHPCCTDQCKAAPSTQRCHPPKNMTCVEDSHCDGESYSTCPTPRFLPNGHECENRGTCWFGQCLSFCESKGRSSSPPAQLEPCTCDTDRATMCSWCCRAAGTNSCLPTPHSTEEGMPCLLGFCRNGYCEPTLKESLKHISDDRLTNSFAFRNLVLVVVLGSAPPFIVFSIYVRVRDLVARKRYRKLTDGQMVECKIVRSRATLSAKSVTEQAAELNDETVGMQ